MNDKNLTPPDFSSLPLIFIDGSNQVTTSGLALSDWLVLSFIKGVGPARLDRLSQYLEFISTSRIAANSNNDESLKPHALIDELTLLKLKWPESTAKEAADYFQYGHLTETTKQKLEDTHVWLEAENHYIISREDKLYPESLRQIPVAPILLYLIGNPLALSSHPRLGIVGARKCSAHGRDSAFRFANAFTDLGFTVVSGGAIGIDSSAHMGALATLGKGETIAVMGAGLDNLYPKMNLGLFGSILEFGGALVSEYPLSTPVKAHLFPPRNRIISGLSLGVFVIEAEIKSGSLISAQYAIQHNREVFALPGRISDKQSRGCLSLIQQGAKLVTCVEDVLSELPEIDAFILNNGAVVSKVEQQNVSREIFKAVDNNSLEGNLLESNSLQANTLEVKIKHLVSWQDLSLSEISKQLIQFMDKKDIDVKRKRLSESDERKIFEFDDLIDNLELMSSELSQALIELELLGLIESYLTGYVRSYESS